MKATNQNLINQAAQSVDKSLISIDENSGIPIWVQLRNRLIFLISSERFKAGCKLPTVRELAIDLGINYNTVSKVYQDIERDGYIFSCRGRGTFVAEAATGASDDMHAAVNVLIDDLMQSCKELGLSQEEVASLVAERVGGVFV
ncbi:MAG: GntR family transcriptional regulator [Raoultibacter sp.]